MSQNNVKSEYMSTKIDLWKTEFKSIDDDFLKSVTHFIGLHCSNFALEDCYNGYVMATNDKRCFVYGETVCSWLSIRHDDKKPKELELLKGKRIMQVDYGWNFFTILTEDGSVYLGGEDQIWKTNNRLKLISNSVHFKKIACGHSHLLLLRNDNRLMAMGWNAHGQITGTKENSYDAIVDTGLENVSKISCGWAHSLSITHDKKLYAWGYNHWGRLGLGDEDQRNTPTEVSFANGKIKDVACGMGHSLFLLDDGKLYGCGWNSYGQLGSSDFNQKQTTPIELPLEHVVVAIASGWSYRFSMAFIQDHSCYVWGRLGEEQFMKPTKTERPVESFAEASALYYQTPLTFSWITNRNSSK